MEIYTGAIRDDADARDFRYRDFIGGSAQFNWEKGYDVEEAIGMKIPVKNQGESGSCGGQAMAYYGQVLEEVSSKTFEERSARFIYAQCFVPPWGSNMRPLIKIATEQGWARESLLTSYENGQPPKEPFMQRTDDITQEIRDDALNAQMLSYAIVQPNIDEVALAISNNYGCILGISGQNNGTWLSEFPQPPKTPDWGHWIYAGRAKMINGKKYIGVLNSWGDTVGDKGWQWLSEDYFTTKVFYPNQSATTAVWYGWTIMFNKESLNNGLRLTIIKAMTKVVELLTQLLKKKNG